MISSCPGNGRCRTLTGPIVGGHLHPSGPRKKRGTQLAALEIMTDSGLLGLGSGAAGRRIRLCGTSWVKSGEPPCWNGVMTSKRWKPREPRGRPARVDGCCNQGRRMPWYAQTPWSLKGALLVAPCDTPEGAIEGRPASPERL